MTETNNNLPCVAIHARTSDLLLKRQLHWLLFLRVLVLSMLLGISVLLQTDEHNIVIPPLNYITYFIAGLYLFTIVSALVLKYIKCIINFAYFQLLADTFITTCLVFFTGGSQSIFTILYFFAIIAGSSMLLRSGGLLIASISTLSYGAVLAIEFFHPVFFLSAFVDPIKEGTVVMHFFAFHGLVFFLVAILSILLSERLQKTEKALSQSTINYDRLAILYKQIFDDITTGIITVNTDGRITSFNHAAEEITGFQAHETTGRLIRELFPGLRQKKTAVRPVTNLVRKDNESIPVGYSWGKLNLPEKEEQSWVYTMQDLSQIKKMEEQMKQSEKMATIGEMAAGIAHEFRNPLAAISGAAQVLSQYIGDDQANQALTNIVNRECTRLEKTIDDFLRFSKPALPKREWFSLTTLVNECLEMLGQAPNWQEKCCTITIDLPENQDCWADFDQIKQVILNLVNNACNALSNEGGGEIRISIREEKIADGKEKTVLEVSDHGPGIPEQIQDQIFAPFFTTRENGTGLGLAIVKQIISSHNGDLKLKTSPDQGTTFTIYLPLPQE
ncbi:MAG: PAS domain S-box protein [Proteobacteria bacterium]|nr:PAS domain S-box protein [Pseudomonadota bacterium]MBU1715187.1 PAS domain S-box protein [Pseudomonadota bacterium]